MNKAKIFCSRFAIIMCTLCQMHWAAIERQRPTFTPRIREAILNHSIPQVSTHAQSHLPAKQRGRCWHCYKELTVHDTQIDHHPQPFRHIRHLWFDPVRYVPNCWQHRAPMTNDPEDYANLVPSCRECNISHKYEQDFNNCVQNTAHWHFGSDSLCYLLSPSASAVAWLWGC